VLYPGKEGDKRGGKALFRERAGGFGGILDTVLYLRNMIRYPTRESGKSWDTGRQNPYCGKRKCHAGMACAYLQLVTQKNLPNLIQSLIASRNNTYHRPLFHFYSTQTPI